MCEVFMFANNKHIIKLKFEEQNRTEQNRTENLYTTIVVVVVV